MKSPSKIGWSISSIDINFILYILDFFNILYISKAGFLTLVSSKDFIAPLHTTVIIFLVPLSDML